MPVGPTENEKECEVSKDTQIWDFHICTSKDAPWKKRNGCEIFF